MFMDKHQRAALRMIAAGQTPPLSVVMGAIRYDYDWVGDVGSEGVAQFAARVALSNMSEGAKRVAFGIAHCIVDPATLEGSGSFTELAQVADMSVTTLKKYLPEVRASGLVTITHMHAPNGKTLPNHYRLNGVVPSTLAELEKRLKNLEERWRK
ncbi:hypothetical protein [Azospirillum formosense]|uniref:hypothetical protein n=1 Tax=Azospirillum formosense TaxID=861533 RepID=UPI00338D82A3